MNQLPFVLILALVLAACGDVGPSVEPPPTDAPASATALPSSEAECVQTPESGAAIAEGLTVTGGGTLRNAFAVALLPESGFGFVVAAEIDGPGIEGDGEIGTWAVGELGGGPIFAANHVAQEFSEWGAAANEGSPADVARDAVATSPEAATAEACVSR